MPLTIEQRGDIALVTVHLDQFDMSNADEFRRDIAATLAATRKLILDLGPVEFVDSRACAAILSCLKQLSEKQGDLKVCRVNRKVRTVFDLIRLHRICDIFATPEEAVQAFSGR